MMGNTWGFIQYIPTLEHVILAPLCGKNVPSLPATSAELNFQYDANSHGFGKLQKSSDE